MANKMLIDATHPEETRVVVLRGNRVEEFDFESASRRQLRGNIYLAKVTRVEPSLQAAFIDYGGNRHGFLAFSEIHPDYYQIPVADRQALIDEEERAHRDAEAEADRRADMRRRPPRRRAAAGRHAETVSSEPVADDAAEHDAHTEHDAESTPHEHADAAAGSRAFGHEGGERPFGDRVNGAATDDHPDDHAGPDDDEHDEHADRLDPHLAARLPSPRANGENPAAFETDGLNGHAAVLEHDDHPGHPGAGEHAGHDHDEADDGAAARDAAEDAHDDEDGHDGEGEEEEIVESVGGDDALEEVPDRAPRHRRQYKIQEVIKRRQIMLVQVVKEERGTKGAALTTYLSLAGRYSVLMPNTARGGGISRKITNVIDRRRLKEIAQDLEVPEGMGIILRTAGAARTKTEIKRDFEYLLRAWETVRDLTLNSTAPTLVYEEGSLVKRSIRDLYNKDIDEVVVAGEDAYKDARDFMRMLMPSHAKNVKPYHDSQPVLARYGIESQLDAMFSPVVQLRSGGYIVINQTEALVAIDVNSGRATREHHIEDTALKTNLEASEEIARQLRLRDLAGLIVIDFIDMDEKRNNRAVERRLKDCLKNDRARIQVGRISHFGLLEMSRQRIRTSVLESSTDKCPHCGGTGHVRSVSSVALQLLRGIEETLQRGATHNLVSRTRSEIALYVLNHKRAHLYDLEHRFQVAVTIASDDAISGQLPFLIEKGEQIHTLEQARALAALASAHAPVPVEEAFEAELPVEEAEFEDAEDEEIAEAEAAEQDEAEGREEGEGEGGGRRRGSRRRRRRGGGRRGETREEGVGIAAAPEGEGEPADAEHHPPEQPAYHTPHAPALEEEVVTLEAEAGEVEADLGEDAEGGDQGDARRRRRRGRRGGRRNRREEGELESAAPENGVAPIDEEIAHAVEDFGGPPTELTTEQTWDQQPREPEHAERAVAERRRPRHGQERRGQERHQAASHDQEHPAHEAPQPEPVAAEPAAAPKPDKPESPRRRSTVREPAPFLVSGGSATPSAPEPQPEPAAEIAATEAEPAAPPAAESEQPSQPRRAGWWAKRMLGDKG
jgi:ribonuclease E